MIKYSRLGLKENVLENLTPMDLILLRGMLRYLPQGCRSRRSDGGSEEIPNNRIRLDWNFKEDLSFEEL